MENKLKKYKVVQIGNNQLQINGKADHSLWEKAIKLTDFYSPWDQEIVKKIEFKALWDETFLFCSFRVDDPEVHINASEITNESINNSDRVELFFKNNKSLSPYYCLEIDPTSRLMDFKAKPNKDFDFDWNWPENDISIKSDIQDTYFSVEIAITLASLKQFKLLKEGKIETGIYRAKYNLQGNGSYEPTWITWVNPETETPNFHTPTSFGVLELVKV